MRAKRCLSLAPLETVTVEEYYRQCDTDVLGLLRVTNVRSATSRESWQRCAVGLEHLCLVAAVRRDRYIAEPLIEPPLGCVPASVRCLTLGVMPLRTQIPEPFAIPGLSAARHLSQLSLFVYCFHIES